MMCLDLCCGLGGWAKGFLAEGFSVVGVDLVDFSSDYPGEFVLADLLTWEGWRSLPVSFVVASTPCEEFSRWSMPWTRAKNPPVPSLALWDRAWDIASGLGVPLVRENVRGAQPFVGRSRANCGPFHLWGDVPAILPQFDGRNKESFGSSQRAQRAEIPLPLSRWVARCGLSLVKEASHE